MNAELVGALNELEKERGIPKEIVFDAIEAALVSAYKRNNGNAEDVRVEFVEGSAEFRVFARKTVVEEVADEANEIQLEEARKIDESVSLNDVVEIEVTPADFGRIAAQTAKQVVIQRIREAERSLIFEEFSNREGDIVTGIVQRVEHRNVLIDLGKAEAILPPSEQMARETYHPGMRLKVYVSEVRKTTKGPQVIVSRTHPGLLKRLFELEVPEIHDGIVELKAASREAGNRSKIAVYSHDPRVDPVGACVGPRGMRVQTVVNELKGERVDVVQWDSDPAVFIANALSPAKVVRVQVDDYEKSARAVVPDHQLSLAIGKEGQNARLAAKLTGWKIDIKSESQMRELIALEAFRPAPPKPVEAVEPPEAEPSVDEILAEALEELIPDELLDERGDDLLEEVLDDMLGEALDDAALAAEDELAPEDFVDEADDEEPAAEPAAPAKPKKKRAKRDELREVLEEVETLDEEPLPSLFADDEDAEAELPADSLDVSASAEGGEMPETGPAKPGEAESGDEGKPKVLKDLAALAQLLEEQGEDE